MSAQTDLRTRWVSAFLSVAVVGAASLAAPFGPSASWGAEDTPVVNEKFSDLEPAIAELRQEAGQDRRIITQANMLLTPTEGLQFWPLYDQYRTEQNKVSDRKVRLITDFLAKRDAMTEDDAHALNKDYLKIEKDKIAVKEKYVAKMSKVLSARTVARFFQIDQKLDAVVDLALAVNIPLIH